MSEHVEKNIEMAPPRKEDEIHLLDLLSALGRQRKLIYILPVITTALAVAAAFLVSPKYVSTAVIMPPQQQSSGVSAVLGQLGGLASAAGGIGGLKNPNDLYVGVLQSRTIADTLIGRFKLKERYDKDTLDETRDKLDKVREVINGKDGLISVSVIDKDPKFAADLANAYVVELAALTQNLAITEASRRRLFFEKQLSEAKETLATAESNMRKMQETTGMLQLDGQVKGIIANEAQLQGTIAAKSVQLKGMRSFATANNPDYLRVQEELRGLQEQLDKLQKGQQKEGDVMIPSGKIPEAGIAYIRSLRDVRYNETIFELLAKQFELAKIDEAKDSSLIQQLDLAVPAEYSAKPKRALIVIGGLVGGFALAIFIALMRELYSSTKQKMTNDQRWLAARKAWK
ncbi:GumC family protein [Janthinobacterium lividum]|uniref:Wzz/FepE/Etk N-terminal domain-containing protein n=1 Tax=Janthinobacterium lividum TaxID=29581 RepID=A0ABU0XT99_9BURK|nr:Wzz/FepE/Etk N-terminal domain-containing protein [Janthinobacterium lividum]MDQ4626753.1 Wzz/FepE/Etk N-terminal domain-containing protein [Janthinobacterium lividum]MDQ4674280.1 Wzz/FepE/Etk N-terminal domain-containing protein [Janthinobacterium lividum]MDQ4685011.1 Wzz/FepE/Etk N-terminal domain-containing protein [Janthinobacterium lividum]